MDLNFNINEDYNKLLVTDLNKRLAQVKLGGGKAKIEKEHAKGKLTARERIDYLLDSKSKSIEVGAFVGDGMYEAHGGCPSGGVVVKIGYIKGKQCIVVANDATVKAGAWFPITAKKKSESARDCHRKQITHHLLSGFCGGLSPNARRNFP